MGLLGITAGEEFGGAGLDAVATVIVHEGVSTSDPGLRALPYSMLFVNNLEFNE